MQERRAAHQRDRHRQQRAPADAVADHAEHQAADRPRERSRARTHANASSCWAASARLREELPADVACEVPVDGEVEPLEDVADQPRKRGANRRLPRTRVPSGCRSRLLTHITTHQVRRGPVRLTPATISTSRQRYSFTASPSCQGTGCPPRPSRPGEAAADPLR